VRMSKDLPKLLDEVDALCALYVGKKAAKDDEPWENTLDRLTRIANLAKRVRKGMENG
jgi:hypothetical protein